MAKIKKSIWSMALGVVMCLTLIVGVVAGTTALGSSSAATSEHAQTYTKLLTSFGNDTSDTSILANGDLVRIYFQAKNIYDTLLTEEDKEDYLVISAKSRFDEIWNNIFKAPHDLADRITDELSPVVERGSANYSDVAVYNSIDSEYQSLDGNQQTYLATLENYEDKAAAKALIDQLMEKINALLQRMESELGEILKEEHKMALADDATYKSIESEYQALDPTAQEYVQSQSQYQNMKPAKEKIDAFMKRLQDLADAITNEFGEWLARDEDGWQGVMYSDHVRYDEVIGEVDKLESDEKAWVRSNSTYTNRDAVGNALQKIQADMTRVINAIENDIGAILERTVRLSDATKYNEVKADFDSLDKSAQAHVQEACASFDNLEKLNQAITARKAELDKLAQAINEELVVLLPDNVRLSNEARYTALKAQYDAMADDQVEKEYVDDQLEETTVLTQVGQKIEERKQALDALSNRINDELGAMLPDQVKLSDETAINEISDAYDEVTDPTEKQYLDNKATEENIPAAKAALQALKDELDALAERIENELGDMLPDNVKLSDEDAITEIEQAYKALDGEEKTYVDDACTEQNVQDAVDALAALKARLDAIAEDVESDLGAMLQRGVKLTDETEINRIADEYYGLTDPEEKAYVDNKATEQNVPDALAALAALKNSLEGLIQSINDLADLVESGVRLSNEAGINDIDSRYTALSPEEKTYVDEQANEENIESAKQAIADRKQELTELAKEINSKLNGKLPSNVKLADEETYNDLKQRYDEVCTDATEKEFVDNLLTNKEVFPQFKAALDAIKERLQNIIDGIDVTLQGMLDRGVQLSDEPEFKTVDEAYQPLPEDEKTYVNEKAKEENIEAVRKALQAIKDRLQPVIDEVEDELGQMLQDGVKLSDEERFNEIEKDYNDVTDPTEKQYVNDNATEENIEAVREALRQLKEELDGKVEDFNKRLHDMYDDEVTWDDKDPFDTLEEEIEALPEDEQAYVKEHLDTVTEQAIKDELDALKNAMDALGQKMEGLKDILDRGVFYSDKAAYDEIHAEINSYGLKGLKYIQDTYPDAYHYYTLLNNSLTEIENRANAAQTLIDAILYRYNGEMVANSEGEIVVDSEESVNKVTTALAAIYDGAQTSTYHIGQADYRWEDKEVTALSGIITGLAEYDAAVATIKAYKDEAQGVADDYAALNFSVENHYKAQEDAFNAIYDRYVALDEGVHNNKKTYIASETQTAIESLNTLLEDFNAWILKVAQLVDANANAENADEVVSAAVAAGVDEMYSFDVAAVQNLLTEYETLIKGSDTEIRVASLAEPYSLLKLVETRINDLNDRLAQDIKDLIQKDEEGKIGEEDFDKMQDILDEYEKLDETQKEKLDESLKPDDSWEEFVELTNKYMFFLYFKSAVEELNRQVSEGYFTVEGYVQEKTLLAMYFNFEPAKQSLVQNQYNQLLAIDEAYKSQDMLDYNKVKDELTSALEDAKSNLQTTIDELQSQLEQLQAEKDELSGKVDELEAALEQAKQDYADADKALKAELEQALAAADQALKAELEQALADADATLKAQLEEAFANADEALKTQLNAAIDSAKQSLKGELETAISNADTALKEELQAAYQAQAEAMQQELQAQIDELKKAVEEAQKANDKVDSLKKALVTCAVIGAIAIVALAACVVVLFLRGNKSSGSNKKEEKANE